MKKPNIFCLIVDAMSDTYASDKYNATPFINELKKKSYVCKNMYSQGPYTCSALTPFYTGKDNLTFGGNFFRGDETTITSFEALLESGYDTYNYTQPLIYPDPMHRGINKERYGLSYFFSAVWDYRLSYFADLFKHNCIVEDDYLKIELILKENFEFWIKYLVDCKTKAFESGFINKYSYKNFDFDSVISEVIGQYNLYKADNKKYINELFEKGLEHPVFKIKSYLMLDKIDNKETLNQIKNDYAAFFKKLEKFNKEHNDGGKYYSELLKSLVSLKKEKVVGSLRKIRHYKKMINVKAQVNKMFDLKANYKPEPHMLTYFEDYKELMASQDKNKPYFFMMHISDLHIPEVFFSLDSNNFKVIKEELDTMDKYLDSLPEDFTGNVIYYLSLRYVDLCVERMFKWFEENNVFDNTVFMLTADHGSSFGYRPLREKVVNNQYVENYHIPFFVYGNDIKPFEDFGYYSTKDIVKTILSIAGNDNEEFTGKNVLNKEGHAYSMVEYFGQGCPDVTRRSALFVIRDDNYSFAVNYGIVSGKYDVLSIFDRKNDPFEYINIVGSCNDNIIKYYIQLIEDRVAQIKSSIDFKKYKDKKDIKEE